MQFRRLTSEGPRAVIDAKLLEGEKIMLPTEGGGQLVESGLRVAPTSSTSSKPGPAGRMAPRPSAVTEPTTTGEEGGEG